MREIWDEELLKPKDIAFWFIIAACVTALAVFLVANGLQAVVG